MDPSSAKIERLFSDTLKYINDVKIQSKMEKVLEKLQIKRGINIMIKN